MTRKSIWISLALGVVGSALVLLAILAERIGLDPSAGWGRTRVTILILGILSAASAAASWRFLDKLPEVCPRLRAAPDSAKTGKRSGAWPALAKYWPALPIAALVILTYVWFASSGTWTAWQPPTRFYADLARGFEQGHLYVALKVDANLLTSPNPYDPHLTGGVQGPLDISYYKGRYYLPWGPVPALILALIHPFVHGRVGDLDFVFAFLCGIYLLQSLLILLLWEDSFRELPAGFLWMPLLLVGLAGPGTFMLNNLGDGKVHDAAAAGGQFFFLAGFACAFLALRNSNFKGLWLAGILWALSIGTRVNLILPIGLAAGVISIRVLKAQSLSWKSIAQLIPLGLPLLLGCAALGWYNWARFGSITESGYYYQLAGADLQRHWRELFSPVYIGSNLYNYLLNPILQTSAFPFLQAGGGRALAMYPSGPSPDFYFSQSITGLIWNFPFAVLAAIPAWTLLRDAFRKPAAQTGEDATPPLLSWVSGTLAASSLAAFVFLLLFFWAAMRYEEDYLPPLMLLSTLGFWQGYRAVREKPTARRLYSGLAILLAAASIGISTLIAVSANSAWLGLMHFLK